MDTSGARSLFIALVYAGSDREALPEPGPAA